MKTTELPNKCPHCGFNLEAVTGVGTESGPKTGDVAMCVYCGKTAVFGEDLTLRLPTTDELDRINHSGVITAMQLFWAEMIGSRE